MAAARLVFAVFVGGSIFASQLATAQMTAPPIPSALPNVSKISNGNAAGVLQYCMTNQLVSTTIAGAIVEALTKQPGVVKSADYPRGQAGDILPNGSKAFSVAQAPGYLKSQACDMVLRQARQSLESKAPGVQ